MGQFDNFALGTAKNETLDKLNGSMDQTLGHNHSRTDIGNGGPIAAEDVVVTPAGDITTDTVSEALGELNIIANLGRVHVPIRQTVLYGNTDGTTGQANFLTTTSGLTVNLLATTTPLVVTFAYNFNNDYGQIDYIGKVTADVSTAWSSLTANQSAVYLYIDRNISSGQLTYGFSLLQPVYSTIAPSTPSTDQHWFDLNSFYMKRYSGSAWVNVQRVFVGECVTGASSVTSVITYALKGQYFSDKWIPTTSTTYTKDSNIGCLPVEATLWYSTDSWVSMRKIHSDHYVYSTTDYARGASLKVTKNTIIIGTGNTTVYGDMSTSDLPAGGGQYMVIANRIF
jgi:hypothetical protein